MNETMEKQTEKPRQVPLKLWKIAGKEDCFDQADLLIAADCSAFADPASYAERVRGRVPLICCPEADFDIATRLSRVFSENEIRSVTILCMERPCCCELEEYVKEAVSLSGQTIPVQRIKMEAAAL